MEYTRTDTKQQSRVIDTRQQSKQTPSIFELLQGNSYHTPQQKSVMQRMLYGNPSDAKELIESQIELQKSGSSLEDQVLKRDGVKARLGNDIDRETKVKRFHDPDFFTTVGFEFEFAQFPNCGKGSILENVLHTQLARSKQIFAYTGLPFFLETDAGSELELVTPPFVIETVEGTSIPLADDVEKADDLMETGITEVIGKKHEKVDLEPAIRLSNMVGDFRDKMGLDFIFQSDDEFDEVGKITNHNLIGLPSAILCRRIKESIGGGEVDIPDVLGGEYGEGMQVIPSHKLDTLSLYVPIGRNGIGTQVNIAMDVEDFQQMADLPKPHHSWELDVSSAKEFIKKQILDGCKQCCRILGDKFSFLAGEIAMHFINTFALEGMDNYLTASEAFWQNVEGDARSHPESSVKDLRGIWFKDSIRGLIDNVFNDRPLDCIALKGELAEVLESVTFEGINRDIGKGWQLNTENMATAAKELAEYLEGRQEKKTGKKPGICETDGSHPFDVRPDTYVDLNPNDVAPGLQGRKMHLVESRYYSSMEVVHKLRRMACLHYIADGKKSRNISSIQSAMETALAIKTDADKDVSMINDMVYAMKTTLDSEPKSSEFHDAWKYFCLATEKSDLVNDLYIDLVAAAGYIATKSEYYMKTRGNTLVLKTIPLGADFLGDPGTMSEISNIQKVELSKGLTYPYLESGFNYIGDRELNEAENIVDLGSQIAENLNKIPLDLRNARNALSSPMK